MSTVDGLGRDSWAVVESFEGDSAWVRVEQEEAIKWFAGFFWGILDGFPESISRILVLFVSSVCVLLEYFSSIHWSSQFQPADFDRPWSAAVGPTGFDEFLC